MDWAGLDWAGLDWTGLSTTVMDKRETGEEGGGWMVRGMMEGELTD